MSLEANKATILSLYEADNNKNLSLLDELISPDFFDPSFNLRGVEGYRQFETALFKGFPDWIEIIEDIIAEGDKVWARYETTGTTSSGKKVEITSISIHRIVNGKIVEGWGGVIRKMSIPKVKGELYEKLL